MFINQNNIGKIRRFLFMPFNCKWNMWVRDITAKLETPITEKFETEIRLFCGMDGLEFTTMSIEKCFSTYLGTLPTVEGSNNIKVRVTCKKGSILIEEK